MIRQIIKNNFILIVTCLISYIILSLSYSFFEALKIMAFLGGLVLPTFFVLELWEFKKDNKNNDSKIRINTKVIIIGGITLIDYLFLYTQLNKDKFLILLFGALLTFIVFLIGPLILIWWKK